MKVSFNKPESSKKKKTKNKKTTAKSSLQVRLSTERGGVLLSTQRDGLV